MPFIEKKFLKLETLGGILLGITTLSALIMSNSFLKESYEALLTIPLVFQIGAFKLHKSLLLWVNDGLMAVFFLLIGLEIKREFLIGKLSHYKEATLPFMAALGGLIFPALVYSYINWDNEEILKGWAIPVATDIAFAISIFSLLSRNLPKTLKTSLLAIAIIDDLAVILLITLFYTQNISLPFLGFSFIGIIIFSLLNYSQVKILWPYSISGLFLWVCLLKSGIHATLAGVLMALFVPFGSEEKSPLIFLEHKLNPWVTYGILPIFAFFNAGVSLKGLSLDFLTNPLTIGIAAGLFLGKQIGVMLFTKLGLIAKICNLPQGVTWGQYYGMSLLTGIGFTMSLFIGSLAFSNINYQTSIRMGILIGSLISGASGYIILRFFSVPLKKKKVLP